MALKYFFGVFCPYSMHWDSGHARCLQAQSQNAKRKANQSKTVFLQKTLEQLPFKPLFSHGKGFFVTKVK